jgi:HD-like signal output (HDOD) protein
VSGALNAQRQVAVRRREGLPSFLDAAMTAPFPEPAAPVAAPANAPAPEVCLLERNLDSGRDMAALLSFGAIGRVTPFDDSEALFEHLARRRTAVVVVADELRELECPKVLRQVQLRHPDLMRVVLTDRDPVEVFRRIPYAHQFFSRSAPRSTLAGALGQCLEVRNLLARPELRALVSSGNALPAAPRTYSELIDLLADPKCSMLKVVSVIERDVGMSSRLTQVVSSAFFGLSASMTSLGACVAYLGLDAIRSLVLSAEIGQLYPGAVPGHSPERVHARALATSRLARRLAQNVADPGQAFVAGLLHGVGQLVLASRAPVKYAEALALQASRGLTQPDAEREVIGATSAEVGAYLLALWGQPLEVVRAIANQDLPEVADQRRPGLATIIYLSKRLSQNADAPLGPASTALSVLNEPFLTRIGSVERLQEYRELARRLAS